MPANASLFAAIMIYMQYFLCRPTTRNGLNKIIEDKAKHRRTRAFQKASHWRIHSECQRLHQLSLLGCWGDNELIDKGKKRYDERDIVRGQIIDFRTADRNCFNAFWEDGIRRGHTVAIRRRRLSRSRAFLAVRTSKVIKWKKEKNRTALFWKRGSSRSTLITVGETANQTSMTQKKQVQDQRRWQTSLFSVVFGGAWLYTKMLLVAERKRGQRSL